MRKAVPWTTVYVLGCRHCGAIAEPQIGPGAGPHAAKAVCPPCGGFLRWLKKAIVAQLQASGEFSLITPVPPVTLSREEPTMPLPVMLCPHCDATDRPTLRKGPTEHTAYAACARCGEHIRLIPLRLVQDTAEAPIEREEES
jgi:hypothetical protein